MRSKPSLSLLFWRIALCALISVIVAGLILQRFTTFQVKISDQKSVFKAQVRYPSSKTVLVQNYIRKELGLLDLTDLNHVEIYRYQPPGRNMSFYFKSRAGYIKVLFDKCTNSNADYLQVKNTFQHLGQLLQNKI